MFTAMSEAAVQRCSMKKVSKNFAKVTGKDLCLSLFFNKVAGLRQTLSLNEERKGNN